MQVETKRWTVYIRADPVSMHLQTASLLYSLVNFLVSCSCLSTLNLVSLVPSTQHPFWPLVPWPPELQAPSRLLKAVSAPCVSMLWELPLCLFTNSHAVLIQWQLEVDLHLSHQKSAFLNTCKYSARPAPREWKEGGGGLTPAANCFSFVFV